MLRIYTYKNCDTCRKAVKWLRERGVDFEERPIRETPPTKEELKEVLVRKGGDLRKVFNTAGGDYRAMGMKDRLPVMGEEEAIELLSQNGNLVKRPVLLGDGIALCGFKPSEWAAAGL